MNESFPLCVSIFPFLKWENLIHKRFCKDPWKTIYVEVARSHHHSPGCAITIFPRERCWRRSRERNAWSRSWCSRTQRPGHVGPSRGEARSMPRWWNLRPRPAVSPCTVCTQAASLPAAARFHKPGGGRRILRWTKGTVLASLPGPFVYL